MTKEQLQKMAHEYVTNHRDAEVRGMYGDHYRTYMAAAQAILACQQQQSDAVEFAEDNEDVSYEMALRYIQNENNYHTQIACYQAGWKEHREFIEFLKTKKKGI